MFRLVASRAILLAKPRLTVLSSSLYRLPSILKFNSEQPNNHPNGGGGNGGNNNDNDPKRGIEPSEDMIMEVYLAMYPEDLGYAHINKKRVKLIAEYLHQLEGIPCILTASVRSRLLNRGYLPSEIDQLTPLQANARLYRLEIENIQHQIS